MNRNTWNRTVKNTVRRELFSVFRGRGFDTFYDIPGVGCLSTIEALGQKVIRDDSTILWAERDIMIGDDIKQTLLGAGLKNTHNNLVNAITVPPSEPVDLLNLDLMCQLSENIVSDLRVFPFATNGGFSITIHHPGTRKASDYLIASKKWFRGVVFDECFNGKTEKLKPHNTGRVRRYDIHRDTYVNTMYGLLTAVALREYNTHLEKVMIYGDDSRENNMVTFVFSNITRKNINGKSSGHKAHATRIVNAIDSIKNR